MPPDVVVADAGCWHEPQMENIVTGWVQVLVPPDAGKRKGARAGWNGGAYAFMRRVLATESGREPSLLLLVEKQQSRRPSGIARQVELTGSSAVPPWSNARPAGPPSPAIR